MTDEYTQNALNEGMFKKASIGDIEELEALIFLGADVNATSENGWTPLMNAVKHGRIEAVHFLLKSGADIKAKTIMGYTPLSLAIHVGNFKIAAYLSGAIAK